MQMRTPLQNTFAGHDTIPFAFREQFLATPERAYDVVLEGVMHEIAYSPRWLKPLFWLLGRIGVLVPKIGRNIPTKLVVNPGYLPNGQPYHEWNRTFDFDPPIHFNTTVVYDEKMQNIADLVGPNLFLHMVWDGQFKPPYHFTLDTITNALRIRGKLFYLPKWLWMLTLGRVKFTQTAHGFGSDTVDVNLRVVHPIFSTMFHYIGTFRTVRYEKYDGQSAEGLAVKA